MVDDDLFGKTFAGPTFAAWRAVAKMLDGLPLEAAELVLYEKLTRRTDAPTQRVQEAYLIKPRRAGGTQFAAVLGLHAALQDYTDRLGPGEWATVGLIASDRRQARQLKSYIDGMIEQSPMIKAATVGDGTRDSVEFEHRVRIEIHTPNFRSTRGYSYACVVLDELSFFRTDESATPDKELVRAVRPGLSNLQGRLIGLSSPHARRGVLYTMWQKHYGVPGSDVLVLQAQEPAMLNPTLDPRVVEKAMEEDPEAARSEWFGQFRNDASQFLADELIDIAVKDRQELPYNSGFGYIAFCDVAGGGKDSSALAIAHLDPRTEHVVLDQLLRVPAPCKPDDVVNRFAAVMQRFYIKEVSGDRWGADWVVNTFKHVGIEYVHSELDKSAIYTEASYLFAERRVEILDHTTLIAELRDLERRPRTGGRGDLIDHPPRLHDDAANAACGALWLASSKKPRPRRYVGTSGDLPEYALM